MIAMIIKNIFTYKIVSRIKKVYGYKLLKMNQATSGLYSVILCLNCQHYLRLVVPAVQLKGF